MWIEKRENGSYKVRERYIDPMTGKQRIASITTKAARKAAESVLRDKIKCKISHRRRGLHGT